MSEHCVCTRLVIYFEAALWRHEILAFPGTSWCVIVVGGLRRLGLAVHETKTILQLFYSWCMRLFSFNLIRVIFFV